MRLLIKSVLILMLIFTSTLILIKFSGILTVSDIKEVFEVLKSQPSYILGFLIVFLLLVDLFIAVPTMTVIILAGYFLGFELAFLYTFFGLLLASFTGYFLSRKYGLKILNRLTSDQEQIEQMKDLFNKHGILVLILSRAVPMLPEISACLAGTCSMSIKRFFIAWSLGTIPYLSVIAYAGSISDLENPIPAIYGAIGITISFWFLWMIFLKANKIKLKNQKI
ncbi:TVP38/TMEM64 family protein [Arcobacter arenosus]|uniref:VTT domain-containing protein n=1 Tax=Arcobacter arenosus TaxID=2576037 RepID=A0A5R8Y4B3_9BACT|nr:VTT domain-containing protein [Arcobacter arenosus]TLP40925.1 VTT domain-containing protein [Arcobacter arenosus]